MKKLISAILTAFIFCILFSGTVFAKSPIYSWYEIRSGVWGVKDIWGNVIKDMVVKDVGNVHYMLGENGEMVTEDGVYRGVEVKFNHADDGTYGKIIQGYEDLCCHSNLYNVLDISGEGVTYNPISEKSATWEDIESIRWPEYRFGTTMHRTRNPVVGANEPEYIWSVSCNGTWYGDYVFLYGSDDHGVIGDTVMLVRVKTVDPMIIYKIYNPTREDILEALKKLY